jgi:hypothetical protein
MTAWSDPFTQHLAAALPDRRVTEAEGHTYIAPASAMREARVELLELAEGIGKGTHRHGAAADLVPLLAHPQAYKPLAAFYALVEAVRDGRTSETQRLLDVLTHERSAA